ncbi:unnamed protein product [Brassica oleracea]
MHVYFFFLRECILIHKTCCCLVSYLHLRSLSCV